MARDEAEPRKWWDLSAFVPEGRREAVLSAALAAAGLFLLLAVVGFAVAAVRGSDLEEAEARLDSRQAEIDRLGLRPTPKQFGDAKARVRGAEVELEEKSAEVDALGQKLEAARRRKGELEAALRFAGNEKAGIAEHNRRLGARLEELTERYEAVRRAASGRRAQFLDELKASGDKLVESEISLARERSRASELEEKLAEAGREHERGLAEKAREIEKRDRVVAKLKDELADMPVVALPEELAADKYRQILGEVAEHEDREERVDLLFRAKLVLAGSAYESKADAAWRKEMRGRQADVDSAARVVYDEVTSKIRVHPQAHDENVGFLNEALEKVRGSKYEERVRRLIDHEHELKASGR